MLHFPEISRTKCAGLAALMVLLPLSFLCYQAWFNPRIQFLVPSLKGEWILHRPDILYPDKLSGTVLFRRRFELKEVPQRAELAVRAASQFRMSVNQHVVEPDSQNNAGNWKFARTYDIAPFLIHSENVIEIRVTNTLGQPALLVQSLPGDDYPDLSSNEQWESAPGPDFSKWRRCVLTYWDPPLFGGERSPIQESPAYPVYLILLGVYALFIIAAARPWRRFYRNSISASGDAEGDASAPGTKVSSRFPLWAHMAILAVLVTTVLTVNIHNAVSYPYGRSYFDAEPHADYIRYVASKWQVPVVTQGWEMFQPPLYYFVSAVVYNTMGGARAEPASLKAVQFVGVLSGLACLFIAWLTLGLCIGDNLSVKTLGWSAVAFLPMFLYINPIVGNEMFSAFTMSLSLYLLMRFGFRERISVKQAIALGIVFGLAMLSKYTALVFLAVAVVILLLRLCIHSGNRRREAATLLIFIVAMGSVCGWFYIRNWVLFHNPMVANWDEVSGFDVEQQQGYRTAGFYLRFGSVFTRAPERSRWYSFWDGNYGSMWMDPHFNMIDPRDNAASSYGTVILGLALLPAMAIFMGWLRLAKINCQSRVFRPDLVLVLAAPLFLLALVWHSLQIPAITTVKAFFSIALLPAFAVFAGIGLKGMAVNLGRYAPVLYAGLIALYALILRLFWYRPY